MIQDQIDKNINDLFIQREEKIKQEEIDHNKYIKKETEEISKNIYKLKVKSEKDFIKKYNVIKKNHPKIRCIELECSNEFWRNIIENLTQVDYILYETSPKTYIYDDSGNITKFYKQPVCIYSLEYGLIVRNEKRYSEFKNMTFGNIFDLPNEEVIKIGDSLNIFKLYIDEFDDVEEIKNIIEKSNFDIRTTLVYVNCESEKRKEIHNFYTKDYIFRQIIQSDFYINFKQITIENMPVIMLSNRDRKDKIEPSKKEILKFQLEDRKKYNTYLHNYKLSKKIIDENNKIRR